MTPTTAEDFIVTIIMGLVAIAFSVVIMGIRSRKDEDMQDQQYPKRHSDVEITFNDGEIQTYRCGFGSNFAPHLARQTGETGVLTLLCGRETYSWPVGSVKGWKITDLGVREDG